MDTWNSHFGYIPLTPALLMHALRYWSKRYEGKTLFFVDAMNTAEARLLAQTPVAEVWADIRLRIEEPLVWRQIEEEADDSIFDLRTALAQSLSEKWSQESVETNVRVAFWKSRYLEELNRVSGLEEQNEKLKREVSRWKDECQCWERFAAKSTTSLHQPGQKRAMPPSRTGSAHSSPRRSPRYVTKIISRFTVTEINDDPPSSSRLYGEGMSKRVLFNEVTG
jgi:hypothetical protein